MASSKSDGLDSVISVLELIKEPMISFPQNYVQIDQQNPAFPVCSDHPLPALPTVDFKLLVSVDTSDSELEKMHSSCKEWGFFQLVNHGVSSSLMNQLKHEIVEYYNLPFEEKRKYTVRPNDFEGYGNAKLDGKLDWGDRFFMITNPVHRRKPHLLPELPPSFRNPLECYLLELQRLAMKLLGFIAEALKVDLKEIEEMFDDGFQSILSNGVYKSVEHRVTTNPGKERISVAFFVCPKLEAEVGPVTSLISPQNPPLFRRTGMEKYCKDFFSRKLHAKSFLETMKIESTEEATQLHGSR
ncbi:OXOGLUTARATE/IRON-DEPENDENT DIOXYGENASE [Salix purpurea]|uniref:OXOGLUTARATE/IRON-DEPENDENT DIOXYGENASE n=1 Tax=Salix purpurea TaxID=77065 RepID=A0A9Q0VSG6_SALPP|nr:OXOGLUTARATE/IRON-DEPENDENT DIOXYGENASE [Salix purpurea]